VRFHGHKCPGQVLGVRMAVLGLKEIGIRSSRGRDRRDLVVFVERDRCAMDAIQFVTGCTIGRGTLRFFDFGKMASTFVNISTGRAVRVVARESAKEIALSRFPNERDPFEAQLKAYLAMSDSDLFDLMDVRVFPDMLPRLKQQKKKVVCSLCGENISDGKEVTLNGLILCRNCLQGSYYEILRRRL
jgi:formylmethanofuran dehydrogenase subunit E